MTAPLPHPAKAISVTTAAAEYPATLMLELRAVNRHHALLMGPVGQEFTQALSDSLFLVLGVWV